MWNSGTALLPQLLLPPATRLGTAFALHSCPSVFLPRLVCCLYKADSSQFKIATFLMIATQADSLTAHHLLLLQIQSTHAGSDCQSQTEACTYASFMLPLSKSCKHTVRPARVRCCEHQKRAGEGMQGGVWGRCYGWWAYCGGGCCPVRE